MHRETTWRMMHCLLEKTWSHPTFRTMSDCLPMLSYRRKLDLLENVDLDLEHLLDLRLFLKKYLGNLHDKTMLLWNPQPEHAPTSSSASSTPSIPVPPGRMETIPALTLNQAMTRSLDALDGISHRPLPVPPPGLQQHDTRERSRSPHRDGANVPVPSGGDAMVAKEMKYWSCFLAKRYTL